eukprot:gnl/MRDRNA2_/MRDRNA2_425438_c0_seq1.p1 gnl/MRDRNA2_/MRDRNA2_425438_c0~~gnl/MRDRNA2_/MRDRNA2_425438_c0_seq1.p1  ORF type:complete len:106 (-),score=4.12 gnl/MRDRNA2_/MRDRNA2_425438_c0_seq1:67-384(-)
MRRTVMSVTCPFHHEQLRVLRLQSSVAQRLSTLMLALCATPLVPTLKCFLAATFAQRVNKPGDQARSTKPTNKFDSQGTHVQRVKCQAQNRTEKPKLKGTYYQYW